MDFIPRILMRIEK